MRTTALLVLAAIVAASGAVAQDAVSLNRAGLDLYNQGRYGEAVPLFEKAIDADPRYVYGHYNLACTLAILLREDYCSYVYETDRILAELETTLWLKPSHREKILEDPDLTAVRRLFEFWRIVGFRVSEPAELVVILSSVEWAVPGPGMFPVIQSLRFGLDNSVAYWAVQFQEEDITQFSTSGTWRLATSGDVPVIRIRFEDEVYGAHEYAAVLTHDGCLSVEGLETFLSFVDDCSA